MDIEDPAVVVEKAGIPVEFIPLVCAIDIHIVRCVPPFLQLNDHFENLLEKQTKFGCNICMAPDGPKIKEEFLVLSIFSQMWKHCFLLMF